MTPEEAEAIREDVPRLTGLPRDTGATLAEFYDRRAAAALAYCSRLCAPDAIGDAVEASFGRVFEAAAAGEAVDDESLEERLRSAIRSEAATRASAATAGLPARRLIERLSEPNRGACDLMPALLSARAEGSLSDADVERMQNHLRRCPDCRTAEHRFDEAERAYDALATDDAPALGRSLLAEMLSDMPLRDGRRFARERLGEQWFESIEWDALEDEPEPTVVPVPEDALDDVEIVDDEQEEAEDDRVALTGPRADPAVTSADTADFPAIGRARMSLGRLFSHESPWRRRIAIAMLVVGALLVAEAALTLLWKEPFTAYLAARAQNTLSKQLDRLDGQKVTIGAADQARLGKITNAQQRTDARIKLLAQREQATVPEGDALGELQARSISSDFVVVQGTNPPSLRKGPGHYRQTALPGMGGTVGIAGHRTTYEAPFRRLDDLKRGDTITLRMPYGRFTYSVDGHRIVPSGYKDAFTGQGGERLVLSACHPLYSASKRILVSAHLVSRQPLGAAVETTAPKPTGPNARQLARQHTAAQLKALGNRTLTLGMRGSDVKELQRLLGLPATGLFGPQTRAAVIAFQTQHGIPPVGNAGSQTKRALARRQHPPSRPPTPPAVPQAQQPSHQGTSQNGTGTSTTPQTTTPNAGGAQGAPTTGTQPTQGH